ncbi:armadillo-type protein, partial [Spinellus fusiger]
WWKTVLKHYLQQASADNSSTVRTAMCDCMSSMSKQVFSRFNPRLQKLSVAFLLPLPRDGEANVRAAACRALGFFVLFPDLREDPLFVSDVALVLLEPMSDKVLAVRVRASWAQGNVCDALVIESERSDLYVSDCISPSLWMQLLNSIAAASLDNDKLRSNAVRALGSLLRITPNHYFQQGRMLSLLAHAMEALIKNIETGTLKTRWNACHAANNLLHNPHFPIGYQDDSLSCYAWTSNFYQALCMSLTQCKNFKVRIHACLALTTPSLYTQYGSSQQILIIVEAILETHRACSEDKDTEFQELGYKQQLLANVSERAHGLLTNKKNTHRHFMH